jgi:hypothetical protein
VIGEGVIGEGVIGEDVTGGGRGRRGRGRRGRGHRPNLRLGGPDGLALLGLAGLGPGPAQVVPKRRLLHLRPP